jgi:small-conductance mechanosensitive channel
VIELDDWRSWPISQNTPTAWMVAGTITLGLLLVLLSLRPLIRRYAERLRKTDRREFLEIPMQVLSRTTTMFLFAVSLFFGLQSLKLGDKVATVVNSAITITVFIQIGLWAAAAVHAWVQRRRTSAEDRAMVGTLSIISFLSGVVIWALVLLAALDNLGVNITALVAGLGIGGVAVALALQNVLGDLFASLSIALDRPFVVGDFLAVDAFLGSVEYIGIKTTRLRSLDGEQIILSNSDILKSRVRNYGRMVERRVQFATRASYTTPVEVIEKIPPLIREAIESQKQTRFDRAHFLRHGESALEFETVYYVLTADYNQFMDIQQAINLRIHRKFTELGVDFAIPVQKLVFAPRQSQPEELTQDPETPAERHAPRAARRNS